MKELTPKFIYEIQLLLNNLLNIQYTPILRLRPKFEIKM